MVVGLPARAIVDRVNRRTVLLWVNWSRATAFLGLTVSVTAETATLPLLYLAAVLLGIGDVFAETTDPVLVPMVVPNAGLDGANTRLYGAMAVAEVVVAPVGGVLAGFALGWAVGTSAKWFAGAALLLAAMRGRFKAAGVVRHHLIADIGEGVKFLGDHRQLRSITLMAATINGCWSAWGALMVLYAVRPGPMGLSEFAYGLLLTAAGIGGVTGTWCAPAVQRRLSLPWAIGINIAGNGLVFLATAVTANPWLIAPAVIVGNIGGPFWAIRSSGCKPGPCRSAYAAALRGPTASSALARWRSGRRWAAEAYGLRAVFAGCAVLTMGLLVPFPTLFAHRRREVGDLVTVPPGADDLS